jgi:uncharacterized phage protein (TIGR02218 family)
MTRACPVNLKTHLEGQAITAAMCVQITRTDSTVYRYTMHDQDLSVGGNTYKANVSFLATATTAKNQLSVDNLELSLYLNASEISKADVTAGLFRHAQMDVFWVNWSNTAHGQMYDAKEWRLGNARVHKNFVEFEVRSKTQLLQQPLLHKITPACRWQFGVNDPPRSRCPVSVASSYTVTGTVTGVTSKKIFADTSRGETADVFAYGKLTWTGGLNNGYSMEVESFNPSSDEFTLLFNMPYSIATSDTYSVTHGCDKTWTTCKSSYSTGDYFGGFPYVPDQDRALQYKVK